MPTIQLRSTLLLLIISLLCAPLHAFVVPWITSHNNPIQTPSNDQQSSYKLRNVLPQLTWLRDSAIEGVFRLSTKSPSGPSKNLQHHTTSELPKKLLAKYGGDVVLRFNLTTVEEERALADAANTLFLDVWEFTNNWADIRLREDDVSSLLGLLPKSLQHAYSNLMPDLAKSIYNSYPSIAFANSQATSKDTARTFSPDLRKQDGVDNVFFKDYQPLSVIVPWMRLMASMFTTHVRLINIGTSFEGRDITALRVGVSPSVPEENAKPRKTIIVSGGSHAREWISVSTVTYIAWSIITSYGKSPAITKLLHEFDFVLIPTINPDGYVFTWENDRLWRKNRQQTNLRFCRGLDIDRGFGYAWDGNAAQSNPCSESYPGEKAFQAVESHRLAKWAKNETESNNVRFVGFLDLHSYSQQVLYPYSYSCSRDPPSLENLEELGLGLAKAIRISSGELYGVASACEGSVFSRKTSPDVSARMETGAGSAIDWFYHELNVRYSYQIKLRDTGSYGFLLPSENIIPTGEEAYNAIKYFGDFLLGNKGIETAEEPRTEDKSKSEEAEKIVTGADNEEEEEEEQPDKMDAELRRRRK